MVPFVLDRISSPSLPHSHRFSNESDFIILNTQPSHLHVYELTSIFTSLSNIQITSIEQTIGFVCHRRVQLFKPLPP